MSRRINAAVKSDAQACGVAADISVPPGEAEGGHHSLNRDEPQQSRQQQSRMSSQPETVALHASPRDKENLTGTSLSTMLNSPPSYAPGSQAFGDPVPDGRAALIVRGVQVMLAELGL